MPKCKSCGGEIIWIKTAASSMPCNPEPIYYRPDQKGAATIVTPNGEVQRATLVDPAKAIGWGYMSHFATCPNAAGHRKKAEPKAVQQSMLAEQEARP